MARGRSHFFKPIARAFNVAVGETKKEGESRSYAVKLKVGVAVLKNVLDFDLAMNKRVSIACL